MKLNDLFPSNYLKKEDVPFPTAVTIKQVTQEEIAGDGGKEMKAVLYFTGNLKPMILNKGNATTIAETYGDDTAAWHGKTIEVYSDPSVMFAGKRVGGLRVRMPANPFAGSSHNNHSQQPQQHTHWDISDGQNVTRNQTTEQVREFFAGIRVPLTQFKVKPAGSPREQARSPEQWGFVANLAPVGGGDDDIPF